MCEVTEKNFESKYDEIVNDLREALFISIDCEFTGFNDSAYKSSLFDTAQVRFNKLQKSFKDVPIIQMGLTTFKLDNNVKYISSTYCFYLTPISFLKNPMFTCQAEAIEFLCDHKFDFNTLFYEGICYLNKAYEEEYLRMIEAGSLISGVYLQKAQEYCAAISIWSNEAEYGSETKLELDERDLFVHMLHREIRKKFPNLKTTAKNSKTLVVRKMTDSERAEALENSEVELLNLNRKIFNSILGFSRIMKVLELLKKPIIGHNMLPDLVITYKQFFNPSAVSYKKFKKDISDIFPTVFDTKRLSFVLKEKLPRDNAWTSNTLDDLYFYLKDGKGAALVPFTSNIEHKNKDVNEKDFHDAGFDSYCTGYCFLIMADIFYKWDGKRKSCESAFRTITRGGPWFLSGVISMKNQVNMVKAQCHYICLDKEDPKGHRPDVLFLKSRTRIDVKKLLDTIRRFHVDLKLLNQHSGLIAVGSHQYVEEIISQLEKDKAITVTKYNFFKHSTAGKIIVSSVITSTVILIIAGTAMAWRNQSFFKFINNL